MHPPKTPLWCPGSVEAREAVAQQGGKGACEGRVDHSACFLAATPAHPSVRGGKVPRTHGTFALEFCRGLIESSPQKSYIALRLNDRLSWIFCLEVGGNSDSSRKPPSVSALDCSCKQTQCAPQKPRHEAKTRATEPTIFCCSNLVPSSEVIQR